MAYLVVFFSYGICLKCELTEVMRQQGDPLFIDILKAARVGELSDRDIEI